MREQLLAQGAAVDGEPDRRLNQLGARDGLAVTLLCRMCALSNRDRALWNARVQPSAPDQRDRYSLALDAQRTGVVALVFWDNAVLAVAGGPGGLRAAVLASRALPSFRYETSPRDPWGFPISVAALLEISSSAYLLPAMRAARIEPIDAIGCEQQCRFEDLNYQRVNRDQQPVDKINNYATLSLRSVVWL